MILLERVFMVVGILATEYIIVKIITDLFEKRGE